MKSIIKEMFEGTLDPGGEIISQDPEYSRLWAEIGREEAGLLEQIPPELAERYAHIQELVSSASCMNIYAGYAYGLRQGSRLCLELLAPQNPYQ